MSQSTSTSNKIAPCTTKTYNFNYIKFGKVTKFADYGFMRYPLSYEDPDSKSNVNFNFIKLVNLEVDRIYKPNAESKNPKYTIRFVVDDSDTKFCEEFNKYIFNYVYNHRDTLIEKGDEYEKEDLEANYRQLFIRDECGKYRVSVSFPFNNPNVKAENAVRIGYKESEVDKEVLQSTDLTKKVGVGSVCSIYLQFTNFKVDDTNVFNIQSTIYKRINVTKYVSNQFASGSNSNSFKLASNIKDINIKDIEIGNVVTNDKQGRSLKPRIKYSTNEGEKTKSITVGIKGNMRFVRMQDSKTNKVSFSVVYNPTDEEVEKFNNINDYMRDELLNNYDKYEKGKKITKKILKDKFRGTVKTDEDGNHTMWFTVYANELDNGLFDFCGNFKKLDGNTSYTNEEIISNIFGHEYPCEMNIYFKHIWFGKYYSCKFNMGSVKLDMQHVEYDIDDRVYYDGYVSENMCSNDKQKSTTNDADLDADEPENSDEESEPSTDEDKEEEEDEEEDSD